MVASTRKLNTGALREGQYILDTIYCNPLIFMHERSEAKSNYVT